MPRSPSEVLRDLRGMLRVMDGVLTIDDLSRHDYYQRLNLVKPLSTKLAALLAEADAVLNAEKERAHE